MNKLKDFFTLQQPKEVASDKERERLLIKKQRFDLLSGITATAIGLALILRSLFDIRVSEGVTSLLGGIILIVLLVTLTGSARLSKYNLNPKDEYENSHLAQGKAAAYDFLAPTLIIIFLLTSQFDNLSWGGSALVALGVSRFIEHGKLTLK
jgi:hypothetical protein